MRIVLVKIASTGLRYLSIGPPLGLMYLASYLCKWRENLDTIKIFDLRKYRKIEGLLSLVEKENPDVIGLSCLSCDSNLQKQFSRRLRSSGYKGLIIAGGPYPTADPEGVLRDEAIDLTVLGEGEETFRELINAIDGGKDIRHIRGTGWWEEGKIRVNEPRESIKDLDTIPFPAWDLIDLEFYWRNYSDAPLGKRRYMEIITSRGCPFHCIYCHDIFGKVFRSRSPENVISEIDILFHKYKIKHFGIIDDIFNFDKARAHRVLDAIIQRDYDLKLSFPNGLRADMLDLELIKKMKVARTQFVAIAIETASPRLQKFIRKNLDLEKAKQIISILRNNGMFTYGFFLSGFPTETLEDMRKTVEYANKSALDACQFFFLNPFKGTPIYDYILSRGEGVGKVDYGYHLTTTNYSDIEDRVFSPYLRLGLIKFYLYKFRIIRTFLHYPNKIYFFHHALVGIGQIIFHLTKLYTRKKAVRKEMTKPLRPPRSPTCQSHFGDGTLRQAGK